ncbi:PaaI family thioesterase [Raineyella antarctica]|nr:hotdog fold thioesterase [Raineyella antarctica]
MDQHPVLRADKASAWLGIEVVSASYGHAEIRMVVREEMLNGFGMAHGGMLFAFADSCFAMACNDPAGDGSTITVAQGADIEFISSAPLGAELTARGEVRFQGPRSGLYDVQVLAGDTVIAEFRGRCRTIPNRFDQSKGA